MEKYYCSKCGKKKLEKEVDLQPIELKVQKQNYWWIDPSTESILQNREIRTMSFEYNALYDSRTGKKRKEKIFICPKSCK